MRKKIQHPVSGSDHELVRYKNGGSAHHYFIACSKCGTPRWTFRSTFLRSNVCLACSAVAVGLKQSGKNAPNYKRGWSYDGPYRVISLPQAHKFFCMAPAGNNCVPEHRLVMAEHLGRPLESSEIIHHINGIKDDNRLSNLELTTNKKHIGLHQDERKQFNQYKSWLRQFELEKLVEQALL